ncbi:hypothetical protein [Propionivibrio dicarboxylicus]|uniref:Cell division protein ZapB n=1 Tax=Propionivibrio dicarboxylicus TaxID=83767 RepID=A0A1G7UWT5_9RHOO|nr:hypothetical protein [Propionivibrio dicarboxylicus]SDG52003.1 hypothetical protein SAMN05660652_00019 [Propionivibrio dicarboxylicus]
MKNELDALERKIGQIVGLNAALRAENLQLRQQLVTAEAEREEMAARMAAACERIEQLVQQLPESKTPDA